MRSHLVLLALVGLAYASTSPAWKHNTEYVYLVNGRTFTSLPELSNQYSGVFLKAKLHIIPLSDGKLQARVTNAQYAQIHSQMPDGWNTNIPEAELSYKQLDLSDKPFQIVMKDGLIKGLIVEKKITNWEANIIKGIVSQFQLDVKGRNAIRSPINILPKSDKLEGVFKTMEETITGKTETSYEMHRLPEYLIQSKPWMVPQLELKGEGEVVEIIKNKNYTNSDETAAYHYGFDMIKEGEPTSNKMGTFFSRQSYSRVIVTGKLSRFTIQNSHTVNKILVNPTLNSKEQGSVISSLNVTLQVVKTQSEQPQELVSPVELGNLVYTYESPFAQTNEARPKLEGQEYQRQARGIVRRSIANYLQKNEGQWSSSGSEETEYRMQQHQSRPDMSEAPEFPLLPYYTGYYGRSIKVNPKFELLQNVKKITKEISEELQDPQRIQSHSTLSKYVMLCSFIRLMNEQEIRSVAEEFYTQSKKGQKHLLWEVYRDAVAETGTGPAFLNIQQWIESRKIEKEEAAEVVHVMSHSVRVPTEEYMRRFFEMIQKPEVFNQEYLNETSLLTYTDLVYKVYVDRIESHHKYPVHSFKTFNTKEGREFVKTTVIPYLTQKLHEAVSQADSRKIHVYIRALGNVGHKQILNAFEPYLEGHKQASQFQRMLMVLSFDKLVLTYPEVARSVSYRIYQNTAEVPEVRSVAAYQLIRSQPSVEMVQHMAENTNTDPQEQVNAVVKSLIESLCELKSGETQYLRKACESARPLLTRKQYGKHQSRSYLKEFITRNLDNESQRYLFQVGSTDSRWPRGMKYEVRRNVNGMDYNLFHVEAMVSSIKELMNVLYKQTNVHQHFLQQRSQQSGESQWSSAKIAESLKLQTTEREQLEGFIFTNTKLIQKLWSFDNETLEQLPEVIRQREEMLKNGKEFSYTKLKQLKEMALSLPTEMGLPFLYNYDMPIFVQFQGKIKAVATPEVSRNGKLHVPELVTADIDAFVTYSTKVQSHLSVVTPFDHQIYVAGFDKSAQAHLPVKANIEMDIKKQETKIEFIVKETHKDARLLQYSSWPFTSRSDIMSVLPLALRPNTQLIRSEDNTHRSFDFVLGQKQTGMSFRVWGHHPQQSKNLLELVQMLETEEISSIFQQLWNSASLQQTEASIAFIPDQTTTRKVVFRMKHQRQYLKKPVSQTEEGFWTMDQLSSKFQQETEQRQKDMMHYVSAGINNAKFMGLDASLEFQGDRTYKHMIFLAGAKSNVSPKSRFVAFYKGMTQQPSELAFQIKGYAPNINGLDVTESFKVKPTAKYEIHFQHGQAEQQSSKVSATVELSRSQERVDSIKQQPLYQACKQQMLEGNRQLSACQNLTIESNYYDDIKIQLQHENIQEESASYIENIFKGIRFLYYPMTEIRSIQPESQNKITLRVQFNPENLRQANFTLRALDEETKLFNLTMSEMTQAIIVPHPMLDLQSRVLGQLKKQVDMGPTCVLDKNAAQTFNNLTYPLTIGNQWTLVMQYVPQQARLRGQTRQEPVEQLRNQIETFAVLVRELSPEQREIKIVFNHPQTGGKTVDITLKPKQQGSKPAASVFVHNEEVHFDDKQAAEKFNGHVEIYALPNGEVKMEIQNWFYLIFDGQRLKLTATSDKVRDSIVGLCGRFSQDIYEDLWTPSNCIMRSTEKFVQRFVVEGTQLEQSHHQYQECIPKVLPLYVDVISNEDIEKREESQEQSHSGTIMRTRYVEQDGDLCFTIHPVPTCQSSPRSTLFKDVPVHCVTKTKTAYYLKNQIDQGGNPDFTQKSRSKTVRMEIPQQC